MGHDAITCVPLNLVLGLTTIVDRYPMFIDAVIHGAAYGFVGTDRSTVSILARRRVFSNGGVTEMVKWGWPWAHDH
jgi:hypothetical protein